MGFKRKRALVPVRTFSLLFLCSIVSLQPSFVALGGSADLLRYDADYVFIGAIRHLVEISNPTLQTVSDGKLFVPLISSETGRYYTIVSNVSSPQGQPMLLNDSFGNICAYWDNVRVDSKKNFSVEIDYNVLSFETHYVINLSLVPTYYSDSDLYDRYTKPEPYVQSDDPEIVSKAYDITEGLTSATSRVLSVYNFVTTYLHYVVQDEERGALWALENKTGDCSEYSYLFVAFCRALGIPARIQAGFAFRSNTETTAEGHMWTEYYLENYGWVPVDPTWRLFNRIDSRHFSSQQSIPEVIPYSNYAFNTTLDLKLKDKQTVMLRPASESLFSNDPHVQDLVRAVWKVREARMVVSIGKVFGTSLIFGSDMANIESSLLDSRILLQNSIDQLNELNISSCVEKADEASQAAWITIAKVFALEAAVLSTGAFIVVVFLRKRQMIRRTKTIEKTDEQADSF